jgi:hypothetical protein
MQELSKHQLILEPYFDNIVSNWSNLQYTCNINMNTYVNLIKAAVAQSV